MELKSTATQFLNDACDAGDDAACDVLSKEEEVKKAWLARLDAPTWGAVAAAVTTVAAGVSAPSAAPTTATEEEAKRAWLAKLDAPTWGTAASTLMDVAGDSALTAELTEKCDEGDDLACDALSKEEEAKKAWLARLDAPTWGAVTAAVTTVAAEVSSSPAMSAEAIAKRAWLTSIESEPSWIQKASSVMSVDAAQQAWQTKLDAPVWEQVRPPAGLSWQHGLPHSRGRA